MIREKISTRWLYGEEYSEMEDPHSFVLKKEPGRGTRYSVFEYYSVRDIVVIDVVVA